MPDGRRKTLELAGRREVQIEEDEREVAVAKEKVSALDGLGNLAAADPEELLTLEIAVGGGIEGIASVDEGEGEIAFFGEELGNEQSHALAGMWGDDFVEAAGFESEIGVVGVFFRRRSGTMRGGELFAEFPAKFVDLQKRVHMFIRTLIGLWSSEDRGGAQSALGYSKRLAKERKRPGFCIFPTTNLANRREYHFWHRGLFLGSEGFDPQITQMDTDLIPVRYQRA